MISQMVGLQGTGVEVGATVVTLGGGVGGVAQSLFGTSHWPAVSEQACI